jgi:hypothetical protein
LGREGFLGSGAGFDSVFFLEGVEVLGSGAFFGGAAALGVGGVLGRELDFFSDLEDLSVFSVFSDLDDFSDFSVFEDFSDFDAEGVLVFDCPAVFNAAAVLEEDDFEGVGGVIFSGGDVLALNVSKGLGHEPMAFGVSSTTGETSFFALASALEVFEGVFGSGVALVAAAPLSGAPLLPVAIGGGGAVSGTAASPNNCRARSLTLGNIAYEKLGSCDLGRLCCW